MNSTNFEVSRSVQVFYRSEVSDKNFPCQKNAFGLFDRMKNKNTKQKAFFWEGFLSDSSRVRRFFRNATDTSMWLLIGNRPSASLAGALVTAQVIPFPIIIYCAGLFRTEVQNHRWNSGRSFLKASVVENSQREMYEIPFCFGSDNNTKYPVFCLQAYAFFYRRCSDLVFWQKKSEKNSANQYRAKQDIISSVLKKRTCYRH